jgi:DNA invertase Pin-like site-specific DNA recombinase
VNFKSVTEPYLDTANELVSHILLVVLSYFAELETKKFSERTNAGLARTRASGRALGRLDDPVAVVHDLSHGSLVYIWGTNL